MKYRDSWLPLRIGEREREREREKLDIYSMDSYQIFNIVLVWYLFIFGWFIPNHIVRHEKWECSYSYIGSNISIVKQIALCFIFHGEPTNYHMAIKGPTRGRDIFIWSPVAAKAKLFIRNARSGGGQKNLFYRKS